MDRTERFYKLDQLLSGGNALGDDVDWLHERSFKSTHGVGIVTCSPDTATGTAIVDELGAITGGGT